MADLIFECEECGWRGMESQVVVFADPERSGNSWNICPSCRAAEHFRNMCDEPGCRQQAGCGWPSEEGYRRTCFQHWRRATRGADDGYPPTNTK